jgi:hypothetical protein
MSEGIDYGNMMQRAMRALVREVLTDVQTSGLPGEHHFFITFDTNNENCKIAQWLHDRYPEDMTIVVQNWYENLEVREDDFSITLNFGNQAEPMVVSFDAIKTFVDPSVEFGLRFESHDADEDDDVESPMIEITEDGEDDPHQDAEIVSLDAFRKP